MPRLALVLFLALTLNAIGQVKGIKHGLRKISPPCPLRPECAPGAICFAGEIRDGGEFRKRISPDLDFVLRLPGGIDVLSRHAETGCKLSSWIANPPLMAHHDTEIDAGYDWTAEMEVEGSKREFQFVQNCRQFQALYDLVYDASKADREKYMASLQGLPKGRLWITGSRVTHPEGRGIKGHGVIDWIKFSVEVKLPGVK